MVVAMPRMVELVPRRRITDEERGPLGRILVRLRGESGLTQEQIGAQARFKQGYYSSLETGTIKRPSDEVLRKLDIVFELQPDTIAYWLDHGPPWELREDAPLYDPGAPLADDEIAELLRRVPADRRGEAARFLRRQAADFLRIIIEEPPA